MALYYHDKLRLVATTPNARAIIAPKFNDNHLSLWLFRMSCKAA
jgi:hypothetical protein